MSREKAKLANHDESLPITLLVTHSTSLLPQTQRPTLNLFSLSLASFKRSRDFSLSSPRFLILPTKLISSLLYSPRAHTDEICVKDE